MSILCIRARFGTPIAHYRATLEVIWTHLYGLYGFNKCNVFFLLSILPWMPVWIEGLLWRRVTSLVAEAQKRVYGAVALDLTSKLPILSHNATSTTPMWWKGMHEILWYSLNARKNKTISDGGIPVDFWFIKVHTSNWSIAGDHRIAGDHQIAGIDSLNLVWT